MFRRSYAPRERASSRSPTAERKRIQRNPHDGAEQRLTSVLLYVGRIRASPSEPHPLLETAIDELTSALAEIRELARGLHPAVLSERGLGAALVGARPAHATAGHARSPARPAAARSAQSRFRCRRGGAGQRAEARGATQLVIRAATDGERLDVSVVYNGADGAIRAGMGDRVEALGGTLTLDVLPAVARGCAPGCRTASPVT